MSAKSRRPASSRWLQRQARDEYVSRARREGWRSRAVFKLMDLQKRDRIVRPGARIIDLGAAPGGWSEYAATIVGDRGQILAVDLLPMDPIPGVRFIQGDFGDEDVYSEVVKWGTESLPNLVMSDMAPNISGNSSIDQPRAMRLAELAAELAADLLQPGGALVVKAFQGAGFEELVAMLRGNYARVRVRKPAASRARSREIYLVAADYQL